jgi:hypothetical protein
MTTPTNFFTGEQRRNVSAFGPLPTVVPYSMKYKLLLYAARNRGSIHCTTTTTRSYIVSQVTRPVGMLSSGRVQDLHEETNCCEIYFTFPGEGGSAI